MRSLRARVTLGSTVVLVLVLALAGLSIVELVDRQLRDELAEQNDSTLIELATSIQAGDDPARLPLPLATDGTEFQITDEDGRWINSTIVVEVGDSFDFGDLPVGAIDSGPDGAPIVFEGFEEFVLGGNAWEVRSIEATAPDGTGYTIEAWNPTIVIDRTVGQVRNVLLFVIPGLAVLFAAGVWFVTGRLLSPVDRITVRARRIRTETLHERIDEPGTDDEIDRLAKTLNEMLDRLERGALAQQRFVSDAAHELQSPLTVMIGEAELAAAADGDRTKGGRTDSGRTDDDRTDGEGTGAAEPDLTRLVEANERVVATGHRMQSLIQDLLDLARVDEATLRRLEVDLDDVLFTEAAGRDAEIDTSAVTPVKLIGDPAGLARVFRNLLDNAERYGRGRIRLSCRAEDGRAVVTVEDDGTGIPADRRDEVFERFARLDTSRTRSTGGTGLGLAIVKAVVDGHGGSISIDGAPLGGARFTVVLPLGDPSPHDRSPRDRMYGADHPLTKPS